MAASRLRLGPARTPTLFGVLAAGVLIAALVITGRSQHLAPDRQAQGRLVVGAARRADDPFVACEGRQRLVGTVTPHGVAGQLIECAGGGLHRDSALVRWRERGAVMAVSVLGQARLQERLALTVAEHTRVLPPSPRNGDDR